GSCNKCGEIFHRAQVRMRRCVVLNRPRRAHIISIGGEGVIFAFPVDLSNGVDRREIDRIESHRGNSFESLGGGGKSSVHGVSVRIPAPGRTGEELIPRVKQGFWALHKNFLCRAMGEQFPKRVVPQNFTDFLRKCQSNPVLKASRAVIESYSSFEQRTSLATWNLQPRASIEIRSIGQIIV